MTVYTHPHPQWNRIKQIGYLLLLGGILIAVLACLYLGLALSSLWFWVIAVLFGLMATPPLMGLYTSPTITLTPDGMELTPRFGYRHVLGWDDVEAIKPFPLLPRPEQEIVYRLVLGKKRYEPAEGMMLVSTQLPWVYRVAGFFAGERGKGVIALTNRSHQRYQTLVKQIEKRSSLML